MVKAGDPMALAREATAVRALGDCCAAVLWESPESAGGAGVLILDRVLLGDDLHPLVDADDDAATREVAALLARMHDRRRRSGMGTEQLPALAGVATILDSAEVRGDSRLPGYLRDRARALAHDLCSGTEEQRPLHGDLHHGNILRSGPRASDGGSTWVAIDPHGWRGDPVFDAAPALANPRSLPKADLVARTRRRIAIVAEGTGWDRDRIGAWTFVGAVIAEARMIRGHGLVHGAPLALAEGLSRSDLR